MSKYYRGLISSINDVKYKLQLASMTLKINENKNNITGIKNDISGINNFSDKINDNETNISDNLGKINTNTSDISDNLGKIETNTSSISSNTGLINTNTSDISNISEFILKSDKDFEKTYNIEPQTFRFNTNNHFFSIFEKEIEHDFIKNSLLFVKNNIYYKYDDLSNDYHRCQHEYNIYDNENNLIHKYLFNKDTYYGENSNILNTTEEFCIYFKNNYKKIKIVLELHRHNRHGFGNINLEIDNNNNYIKLDYIEKGFLDNSHLINLNTGSISTNSGKIDTNTSSIASNSGLISTNTSSISTNLGLINTNTGSISTNLGKINTNTSDISNNLGLINTNTGNISSNLEKITALQTSNIKAFYNLDQIFIYDMPKRDGKTVDRNNHFHIFEKEITYNFTKNSYLEIALKVLTEISNYVLIGFFQILCNFYDQDNNLFYTISLSTAMGSINKLSTIKSVFMVPINENITKIKIDFFIAPKETQQNRSATFTIKDINSNKIYLKYFQKTDEMSIKNIQDSLDNVKNINLEQIDTNKTDIGSNLSKIGKNTTDISNNLSEIESIKKSIFMKNLLNILYYDVDVKVSDIFFEKTYLINAKKTDFLEIQFKILLKYDHVSNAKYVNTIFTLYDDDDNEVYWTSYNNSDYINDYGTDDVLLRNYIYFTFDHDITNLKIRIGFTWSVSNIDITYSSSITDRLVIKHYGN